MRRTLCLITVVVGAWASTATAIADPSSWRIEPSPTPAGNGAVLSSVSCSSTTDCVAVGNAFTASFGQVPLAEQRSAGGWSIQDTPIPGGNSGAILSGVSCPGPTCVAVGTSYSSEHPGSSKVLIERWNGTSWQVQSAPSPSGLGTSGLDAISCSSEDSCQAVGTRQEQYGQPVALAEGWNGHDWSIEATPPKAAALTGVSCTSATACTAVGWFLTGDGQATIAERWNGSTWTVQSTPATGPQNNFNLFSAVSCSAPQACTAVGNSGDAGHGLVSSTLAEAWRGSTWFIQPTSSDGISSLAGVSCVQTDACTAVGNDEALPNGGTTIQHWNGRLWQVQPQPLQSSPATLSAVSCPTLTVCTAVGSNDAGATLATLVERYAGP